ncbi:uncharacterized protein LOC110099777 isoform X2 [Dendrobium catenatum]|uniref:uncharacterized protein LOC110099777 isoform X2 n=1 Tax=Dendrobium catenatum TaxID=906689 RepID=UPI0009F53B98|nr:uncharacterized protein LOC110099777 isoform X2 [Dendrobium catenatum]
MLSSLSLLYSSRLSSSSDAHTHTHFLSLMVYLTESEHLLRSLLINPFLPAPTGFFSRLNKVHIFLVRYPKKASFFSSKRRGKEGLSSVSYCLTAEDEESSAGDGECRPPFDLNLAVLLAGFAFEAYTSPPIWGGVKQIQLSAKRSFLREVYDGQLYIKLLKGVDLPAMDPWGTSDPYVIFQVNGQIAKSNVKWGSTDPTWNEDFTLNIKLATAKKLQVNAWDANLVTPHKRMGNGLVNLQSICDGNLHEVMVELEGIGGCGKIYLEIKYKSFDEIYEEKQWWRIPFVSDFLLKSNLGSALRMVLGSENLNVSQFVESAFGQLKSFNYNYVKSLHASKNGKNDSHEPEESLNGIHSSNEAPKKENIIQSSMVGHEIHNVNNSSAPLVDEADGNNDLMEQKKNDSIQAEYFWKAFTDIINQTVFLKLGVSLPEIESWDKFDLLNNMSIQLRRSAEEKYVEFGLATPKSRDKNNIETSQTSTNAIASSSTDIRIASRDLLSQTDAILGALVVLAKTFSKQKDDSMSLDNQIKNGDDDKNEGPSNKKGSDSSNKGITLSTKGAKEMRELFSSAESAMEAWAMLATSLGRSSFIKSEFEKICFLDNVSTDTQVAIWRDSVRRRLVVAFRGTEQAKWKDLLTDLMFLPAGLNPERLGGDFKQEVQVHGGFLNAYDSVRNRLLMLIKLAIGYHEEHHLESMPKWNVYVTGHSLGGALATLLALEISTSPMAKHGMISVTMYNFGSPRVGNRRFADIYNEKVKDSWRVVNHRDIIPTVPRLMGYCHVAQPVYLAAGDLEKAMLNRDFRGDGYEGDVIGEATPEVLVSEFMKGEKQLIEKILQTEINLLQSIRDGTALMQHMEDFYYISLLESVRSNYMLAENTHSYGKSIRSTA